jgi:hypothetical protein
LEEWFAMFLCDVGSGILVERDEAVKSFDCTGKLKERPSLGQLYNARIS